jgi:hypothetical protein
MRRSICLGLLVSGCLSTYALSDREQGDAAKDVTAKVFAYREAGDAAEATVLADAPSDTISDANQCHYERNVEKDYPWKDGYGNGCPPEYPSYWGCGDADGGPAPGDCVRYPDPNGVFNADWCCV